MTLNNKVAFIEEPQPQGRGALAKHAAPSGKPIQTQILFILTAKSGDERNKWTAHLQAVTGKMVQGGGGSGHLTR